MQQCCSTNCANAGCARHLVRGIAAQCDKIRNLPGIDAIPRANLSGTDPCHLARSDGIENGGVVRGKLEGVAVTARNEGDAAALFFRCGSSREKIIRLEAGRFRILEAAGGNNSGSKSSCSSKASSNSRPLW